MRKLIAALACRNDGLRLYGKPLQNLDIEKQITVLKYIIGWIRTVPQIQEIVLGISEGAHNTIFQELAKENEISFIIGDKKDVLSRLIRCGENGEATDIFRITTESPFTYFEGIEKAWIDHVKGDYDASFVDHIPVGSSFEIFKLEVLKYAHAHGEDRHRSELCSLYIRENRDKFKIQAISVDETLKRPDIRLTIDYPEDLILCRAVYSEFKSSAPCIPLKQIIDFLDSRPDLKDLVAPFVQSTLKKMYL